MRRPLLMLPLVTTLFATDIDARDNILILIADVYAVLQIAESKAGNGRKALWIAIVVVLPVLGLILWYLMGPKPRD